MKDSERVGLPPREFLYTEDQVEAMLSISHQQLQKNYVHYTGLSVGAPGRDKMVAVNIAPEGRRPDWRIPERNLTRWLKFKGLRFYTRGFG